jgi:hypothetical protein
MQRRDFLHLSALAAAGFTLDPAEAASLLQPTPPAAPRPWPAPFDSAPVLQNPAADSITIAIAVNALSTAWIEYGTNPSSLSSRADASRHGLLLLSSRFHSIRLTDLKPGTTYSYRFGAAPIDFKGPYKISRAPAVHSKTFTFTTLNPARSRASLSIINDTHETSETLTGVTGQLAASPADLLFWNGDIFNDVRSDAQIIDNTFRPADTDYAANTPLCFVSGNHDVRGIHARFLDLFLTTPDNRRHYILRQGPIAIVVLDTGEDKPDSHEVYAGLGRVRALPRCAAALAGAVASIRVIPLRLLPPCHPPHPTLRQSRERRLAQQMARSPRRGTHRRRHLRPRSRVPVHRGRR